MHGRGDSGRGRNQAHLSSRMQILGRDFLCIAMHACMTVVLVLESKMDENCSVFGCVSMNLSVDHVRLSMNVSMSS